MFQNTNALLRTLVLLALVVIAGWWTFYLRGRLGEHEEAIAERDATIADLNSEVAARDRRIADLGFEIEERDRRIRQLEVALDLLKIDHRLARIEILEQTPSLVSPGSSGSSGGRGAITTRMRFTELGPNGEPLGPSRELQVEGRRVYLESLVVKFEDDYVEAGDFLRGTSVCLLRRAFGENQKPSEGVPLDLEGRRPLVYAGDDDPDPFYGELWARFWDYANDPELARGMGVRAIHGEAPFMEVRPGRSYLIELRASGGLTIRAE
ncbi:MAG: hypothetical protein O7B99_08815 [Planctomycetota bacterium]|nr:hypothetical protein [Planctomycetota bacterium]